MSAASEGGLIAWSHLQQRALDAVIQGRRNVFLTGGGGVGKSRLIQEFRLRAEAAGRSVVVAALTGIAAINIGGITLHSFLKMGPDEMDKKSPQEISADRAKNPYFAKSVRKLSMLIIDEVSMMEPRMLHVANSILMRTRDSSEPFGGLQVVLVGDFFQLPPVSSTLYSDSNSSDALALVPPLKARPRFIFQTELFFHLVHEMIELAEAWRQPDPAFASMLGRMRRQALSPEDIDVLQSRLDADITTGDGILPTQLSAKNVQVDAKNAAHLEALKGTPVSYKVRNGAWASKPSSSRRASSGGGDGSGGDGKDKAIEFIIFSIRDKLLKDLNMTSPLTLKIGAQVMLITNFDVARGLVNGSRGVVVGFSKAVGDVPAATKKPSRPDDESIFSQRTLEEPYAYPDEPMPIVQFSGTGEAVGPKMQVPYYRWTRETPGLGTAYVWNVPLRLAWSSTVHKSQGLSLNKTDICLDSSVFEEGQAYVAVSRVRTLEGLRFSAFDPRVIRANPDVLQFYSYNYDIQRAAVLEAVRARLLGESKALPLKRARDDNDEA